MTDAYRLETEVHPKYVRARATGPRTPDNAARFLEEAYEACVKAGRKSALLEMDMTGPSLEPSSIFRVILDGTSHGLKLDRVAYVDRGTPRPERAVFAETVAANRGINVKFFADSEAAARWLSE